MDNIRKISFKRCVDDTYSRPCHLVQSSHPDDNQPDRRDQSLSSIVRNVIKRKGCQRTMEQEVVSRLSSFHEIRNFANLNLCNRVQRGQARRKTNSRCFLALEEGAQISYSLPHSFWYLAASRCPYRYSHNVLNRERYVCVMKTSWIRKKKLDIL